MPKQVKSKKEKHKEKEEILDRKVFQMFRGSSNEKERVTPWHIFLHKNIDKRSTSSPPLHLSIAEVDDAFSLPFLRRTPCVTCFLISAAVINAFMDKSVEKEVYYHGLLPREDLKGILKKKGDFLLRMSEPHSGERALIVSVMVNQDKDDKGVRFHYIYIIYITMIF